MRATITALILVTGCAPLQQAPLMYTSKQVLGVDISAPTTESTGVTMNLGFKNVDAAYVPIAVSKENNSIELVTAEYGSANEDNGSPQELEAWVTNLKQAILAEQIAQNTLNTIEADYVAAQQYNNYISLGNKDQAQALASGDSFKSAKLARIKAATLQDETISSTNMEELKKSQEKAQTDLKQATTNLNEAKRQVADSLEIQRKDAMSVYGSFGSTIGDNSSLFNNKLGKMFSTGVAAQNLTEGIARESEALAIGKLLANCLEVSNGMGETKKKEFVEECAKAALPRRSSR